jgi:hypothetical protein
VQSKVKQMMIFAYDRQGMIMTEFHVDKCDSSVLSQLVANIAQKNAQKLT